MLDREMLERLAHWDEVLDDSSYYEILGVLEICDHEALRQAYHEFALAFHPDVHRGAPDDLLRRLRRIFQRGTEAYRVLSDQELRIKYDMALARGQRRMSAALAPRATDPPPPSIRARPLDELARSAGAKLCSQKAAKLIHAGDLAGAKRELERALEYDGGANPALRERLEALEVMLFAQGD